MSNPYQIRTDVLAMAKDMLDKQYESQMKMAQTMYDINKDNMELAQEAWKKYIREVNAINDTFCFGSLMLGACLEFVWKLHVAACLTECQVYFLPLSLLSLILSRVSNLVPAFGLS